MTNSQSSRMEVPQAKEAMDKFKMEVASELGVPLKNGDITVTLLLHRMVLLVARWFVR